MTIRTKAQVLRRLLFVLALASTTLAATLSGQGPPTEYQVKAAFIYNFAKFVEWPADVAWGADGAFVITVLGEDPFRGVLDDTLHGKSIGNRKVVIRHVARAEEVGPSQILFISDSETRQLPRILKPLEGAAVLTVGDIDQFAERGGVVCFRTDKDRVRLEINVSVAERARLRISSELLKLARIVGPRSAE